MFFVLFFLASCSSPTPTPAPEPTVTNQYVSNGWEFTDALMMLRQTVQVPGGEWEEITPHFLQTIAHRRAHAMQWSRSRPTPINVVFVGMRHGMGVSDHETSVINSQSRVVDAVNHVDYSGGGVITIEASGYNGRLSWDTYLDSQIANALKYNGKVFDRAATEIQLVENAASNADVTLLRSPITQPIICGEEIPLLGAASNMGIYQNPTNPDWMLTFKLLIAIRSEMTLVRGLEYLEHHGGNTVVVTQGNDHRKDFERFATDYGINLRVVDTRDL